MSGWLDRLTRGPHPRLAQVVLAGAAVGAIGVLLVLTAGPAGHRLGTVDVRLAVAGGLAFAFGASGLVAFAAFERGFD